MGPFRAIAMQSTTATKERGLLTILMSMIGTRLELLATDIESHAQATLSALLLTLTALLLGIITFTFIGIAVIVWFWDTHRIAAAAGVLVCYALAAVLIALRARAGWRSRPPALAGTLHELDLDRQAFRREP